MSAISISLSFFSPGSQQQSEWVIGGWSGLFGFLGGEGGGKMGLARRSRGNHLVIHFLGLAPRRRWERKPPSHDTCTTTVAGRRCRDGIQFPIKQILGSFSFLFFFFSNRSPSRDFHNWKWEDKEEEEEEREKETKCQKALFIKIGRLWARFSHRGCQS